MSKRTRSRVAGASGATQRQMEALCELSDRIDRLFADDNPAELLGPAMLTFSRPSGNAKAAGFYQPNGWEDEHGNLMAEIAINPEAMAVLGFVEVVQTLAHEKCHQWQDEHGKPSRGGYHNRQWAEKMMSIGLMPSHNGQPGGKRTGPSMADYVIEGGKLDELIRKLPKRLRLPFMGSPRGLGGAAKPKTGYVKHTCPQCGKSARASANFTLQCWSCAVVLEIQD